MTKTTPLHLEVLNILLSQNIDNMDLSDTEIRKIEELKEFRKTGEAEINEEVNKYHQTQDGDITYSHPSFGMVRLGHTRSSDEMRLFGSDVKSDSLISLEISTAECTQHLGYNQFMDSIRLLSIYMTPVQFSELITNTNSSGVPCTFKAINGYSNSINRKHVPTLLEYNNVKIDEALNKVDSNTFKLRNAADDILGKTGTITKADRQNLQKIIRQLGGQVKSSVPFYKENAVKSIEKAKNEAATQIHGLEMAITNRLGQKVLDNPVLLDKTLGIESDEK